MKRRDLLRHLESNSCRLLREGGNHSIWENTKNGNRTAILRHKESSNIQRGKFADIWK